MAGSERGGKERRDARYRLILRVNYPGHDAYFNDWTENISSGGLFVRTDLAPSVGDQVEVDSSFPGLLEPLRVTGSVVWRRPTTPEHPGGIGLQVEDDASRLRLVELALRGARGAQDPPKTRSYRVLLVEDDSKTIRLYRRVLARLEAAAGTTVEVDLAENGRAAQNLLRANPPYDLVITDIYMPEMDGIRLVEWIRSEEKTAQVPVIVVTCGGADEAILCRRVGADSFLQKPVDLGQILETIVCLMTT